MNLLVTAGNTQTPIDRVRYITNFATGYTGAYIALHAHERGHTVTLLTSQDVVAAIRRGPPPEERWKTVQYRTFDELRERMAELVCGGGPDAIIHSAAVSDYRPAAIYRRADNTRFCAEDGRWESTGPEPPALIDLFPKKVKSDEPELWLRLVCTPKLIDCVRREWGFRGILVGFKLEVRVFEEQLLEIAERSRQHSAADLMVANTLEHRHLGESGAVYLGPFEGRYDRFARSELKARLLDAVERLHGGGRMANVLLGVTGSVAAILTPALYEQLRRAGHQVKVVATAAALYFFDPAAVGPLDPGRPARNPEVVILDEDEWPGLAEGRRWQRGEPVLHIRLRRWADLLLIAPLDANTLAKFANGLADNCLTCVWRAWEPARPVVLAPAMNTLMWQHPLTGRHLRQLAADAGAGAIPVEADLDAVLRRINESCPRLRVVPPQTKLLADGDHGVGGLAALDDIASAVEAMLRI